MAGGRGGGFVRPASAACQHYLFHPLSLFPNIDFRPPLPPRRRGEDGDEGTQSFRVKRAAGSEGESGGTSEVIREIN